jgi:hypothetical protein
MSYAENNEDVPTEFPDCLVLKIVETDCDTNERDTTMFVLYDYYNDTFIIRGKRENTVRVIAAPYSFICHSATDLADFISFVICKNNNWSYTLYNCDNLPADSVDIDYEFLHNNTQNSYELAGYDNKKYGRNLLLKLIRMLRNVHNPVY